MLNKIIEASGIPFRETQWTRPPAGTYGVWMDDIETDGPDGENRIFNHDITAELYEPKPDPAAEEAFEAALNAAGLHWTKQARYWLSDVQRYQVIYAFSYTIKI